MRETSVGRSDRVQSAMMHEVARSGLPCIRPDPRLGHGIAWPALGARSPRLPEPSDPGTSTLRLIALEASRRQLGLGVLQVDPQAGHIAPAFRAAIDLRATRPGRRDGAAAGRTRDCHRATAELVSPFVSGKAPERGLRASRNSELLRLWSAGPRRAAEYLSRNPGRGSPASENRELLTVSESITIPGTVAAAVSASAPL